MSKISKCNFKKELNGLPTMHVRSHMHISSFTNKKSETMWLA